jgi:hypothetical protein
MEIFQLDDIVHNHHIRNFIKKLPPLDLVNGPWVAGGAVKRMVNNEPFKADVDVFFSSEIQRKEYLEKIESMLISKKLKKFKDYIHTKHTAMFFIEDKSIQCFNECLEVQLISRRYYSTIQDIFADFDFSICCFATDGDNILTTEQSLEDLVNKQFSLSSTNSACNTLFRLRKYMKGNFLPIPGTITKIVTHPEQTFENRNAFYG